MSNKIKLKEKYEAIDNQILDEISNTTTDKIAEKMREMWMKDTSREETQSKLLWQKKQSFLDEYAANYGKDSPPPRNVMKHHNQRNMQQNTWQPKQSSLGKSTNYGNNFLLI